MNITVNNYESAVENLDFSKLPEAIRMVDDKWGQFYKFYGKSDKITEMVDNHIKSLKPYLKGDKKTKVSKPKTTSNKSSKLKVESSKSKAKSTSQRKSKPKKIYVSKENEVASMPLEVRFIKRYLKLHNTTVTEKKVLLLYKAIQRSATEKLIRKTSKFADEIKKIGNDLAKTYKEMDSSCSFEIPSTLLNKLNKISDSYAVSPIVAFIKRFINLYGNIDKVKAQRLLTSIENATKKGKVSTTDLGYSKLASIEKKLENYLNSDKLSVSDVELNGLRGFTEVNNVGK